MYAHSNIFTCVCMNMHMHEYLYICMKCASAYIYIFTGKCIKYPCKDMGDISNSWTRG